MARMPIEIILIGKKQESAVTEAIRLANQLQSEFEYCRLAPHAEQRFTMLDFERIDAPRFLDSIDSLRKQMKGYHPFLVAVVDAPVDGSDYGNLFCSSRGKAGIGVLTSANVPGVIIKPPSAMSSYYLYYFASFAHSYIAPEHKNHDEPSPKGCIYDRKVEKLDLLKSMRAGAFCDYCRTVLVSGERALSPAQFEALELLYAESGKILRNGGLPHRPRQRVFIGSSTEGLPVARELQASLSAGLEVEIWDQGTVFGLGRATLEALENTVSSYDFGVFVFTPDDELLSRGSSKPVARDNVVFEMGLFAGRLGRLRAFVVKPKGDSVALPSDLAGISTASYDPDLKSLAAAVEPACERIRDAIELANLPIQPTGSVGG
ncbi:MAG TPA: nucleotide-binding protein [Thermoanaerobaculia bacterium]|jgi:predicted nucleotide-binding protein